MHAERRSRADARIATIARRQRWVAGHGQLLAAGLTDSAIRHRVARGRLVRIHRGVYLVGHVEPPAGALEMAALLVGGHSAALSHGSAAARWRITAAEPGPVEVTVAAGNPRSTSWLRVHRAAALETPDVRRVGGLRVTSPARTLLDLAGRLDARDLRWLVEEARVRRVLRPGALEEVVDRLPHRRGAGALRTVLRAGGPARLTRSEAERRLLDLVRAAALPEPATNVRLHGHEVDALWRRARLVVEVDGFAAHGTRAAFERDRLRDARLQSRGFRVLRVTWRQLTDEPHAVVALLARTLALAQDCAAPHRR